MNDLSYIKIDKTDIGDLLSIMNQEKLRAHLIHHEIFDELSIKEWIRSKVEVDKLEGCKVRAILFKGKLAGWCGIQLEAGKYELAIVIDETHWGLGKHIFHDLMRWAKELGHSEVYIHFLHTRPEYKFMRRISSEIYETKLLGSKFRTYKLRVN